MPGGILTRGLRSRSPTLYTAGLRAHGTAAGTAGRKEYNNTKITVAKVVFICYNTLVVRKWLRGRASPCQGEGREFESRLPLHQDLQPPEMQIFHTGVWRSLVACLTGGQEASGSSPDTPTKRT